jgi:hypothetical protein
MSDKCVVCESALNGEHILMCEQCWQSHDNAASTLGGSIAWAAKRARQIATRQSRRTDKPGESQGD